MRVLWITEQKPPHGGVQRYVSNVMRALSPYCEVVQARRVDNRSGEGFKSLLLDACDLPARAFGLNGADAVPLRDILAIYMPDIIHFSTAIHADCRAAIPVSIATVATIHGNDLTNLKPHGLSPRVSTEAIVGSLNSCNFITAVSSHTAGLASTWGVKARINIITPGCNTQIFKPNPDSALQAREKFGLSANRPLILTVARLVNRKGHANVFSALQALSFPVTWCVVGDGPMRLRLARQIEGAGRGLQVRSLSDVSDMDLVGLYNACDVFVLTPEQHILQSKWLDTEGFGLVLHEASACGKPVITSSSAGCKEAIIDGCTGILVPPASPLALAEALKQVLGNLELQQRLGDAGLLHVHNLGGWEGMAKVLFEAYEDTLRLRPTL